jgi:hypothetical protein
MQDIEQCEHTSMARRLNQDTTERLQQLLRPIASGLPDDECAECSITLGEYIETLRALVAQELTTASVSTASPANRLQLWAQQVATLAKRHRAFGNENKIAHWQGQRNMRALEIPFA